MSRSNKWTEDFALDFIFRNCTVIKTKFGAIIVKNGTAGNGALGAIDFIRNYTNNVISIASEETFEGMA